MATPDTRPKRKLIIFTNREDDCAAAEHQLKHYFQVLAFARTRDFLAVLDACQDDATFVFLVMDADYRNRDALIEATLRLFDKPKIIIFTHRGRTNASEFFDHATGKIVSAEEVFFQPWSIDATDDAPRVYFSIDWKPLIEDRIGSLKQKLHAI